MTTTEATALEEARIRLRRLEVAQALHRRRGMHNVVALAAHDLGLSQAVVMADSIVILGALPGKNARPPPPPTSHRAFQGPLLASWGRIRDRDPAPSECHRCAVPSHS